jgi:hypothetical protein
MPWDLRGNAGTNPNNNFLGTTDNQPLAIRTNGLERMRITTDGDIYWGNNSRLGQSAGGSIELMGHGTPGTPYIDFHFQDLPGDFNTRIINDASGQLTISADRLRTLGNVAITGGATVGAGGGAAVLQTRHIHGKGSGNDLNGPLFLNWDTGQPVYIGNAQQEAPLYVVGEVTISGAQHSGAQQAHLRVIGDATISGKLGTNGELPTPREKTWGGGLHTWDVEAEGTIWSMNGYAEGSDARMKANVAKLGNVLDKLDAIRGVSFERIQLGAPTARAEQRRDIGVIAQEVERVFPELVSVHGHENNKAVNYSGLAGVLIEAVKELKAQNETLQSRIAALGRA